MKTKKAAVNGSGSVFLALGCCIRTRNAPNDSSLLLFNISRKVPSSEDTR